MHISYNFLNVSISFENEAKQQSLKMRTKNLIENPYFIFINYAYVGSFIRPTDNNKL